MNLKLLHCSRAFSCINRKRIFSLLFSYFTTWRLTFTIYGYVHLIWLHADANWWIDPIECMWDICMNVSADTEWSANEYKKKHERIKFPFHMDTLGRWMQTPFTMAIASKKQNKKQTHKFVFIVISRVHSQLNELVMCSMQANRGQSTNTCPCERYANIGARTNRFNSNGIFHITLCVRKYSTNIWTASVRAQPFAVCDV